MVDLPDPTVQYVVADDAETVYIMIQAAQTDDALDASYERSASTATELANSWFMRVSLEPAP